MTTSTQNFTINKHKIFILEGPRCAGKTTIANYLQSIGFASVKVQRGEDPLLDQMEMIANILESKKDTVIDRFHLTEYVMSIFHQRNDLSVLEGEAKFIDAQLRKIQLAFDLHVVIINPFPDIIEKRLEKRPESRKADMPPGIAYLVWDAVARKYGWSVITGRNGQLDTFRKRYNYDLD